MNWRCDLCGNEFSPNIILNHIRLMHPDQEVDFPVWPDGGPVIHEDADEFFL